MKFTYSAYKDMIDKLKQQGYSFCSYKDWGNETKEVILRHDVDFNIQKVNKIAEIEALGGVKATYFFLLSSDFYNLYTLKSAASIRYLVELGHSIGLHFDETRYPEYNGDPKKVKEAIIHEAELMSKILYIDIETFSMHRPSTQILESDIEIPGLINSYGKCYMGNHFKYVSDSRRRWREPIDEIIDNGKYNHLHILTHPFWYQEREFDLHDALVDFINKAHMERYDSLCENITGMDEIIKKDEIMTWG